MYLLDTNFVINLHKKKPEILQFLLDNSVDFNECAISVITKLEVLGFAQQSEQDKQSLADLIERFYCFELDVAIQQKTIFIRQRRKIKLPDAIILATALMSQKSLITADEKLNLAYHQFMNNQA